MSLLKELQNNRRAAKNRKGAMLVLIAVMLIAFLCAVAFSVDIAFMHLTRTELRTATDAASKAAALELSQTFDENRAIQRGQEIALQNTVAGDGLILTSGDFEFGRSDEQNDGRFLFQSAGTPRNSVRVNGRRTQGSAGGPIPLFFGNIMGMEFFEPQARSAATYVERDVVLVVDRSGSMAGAKIRDLVQAIDVFVATLNETPVDERVGLASYNASASQDVQLTSDLNQISSTMRSLPIGGFTSISRGMSAGQSILNNGRDANFVERTFIVMTDGRHNRGPEPRTVATQLAAQNVQIHTITFGGNADQARMREVAQIGSGEHFHALTGEQLREIYREIALTLSTVMTE